MDNKYYYNETYDKQIIKFHKDYYDLPLHKKLDLIGQLDEGIWNNPVSYERIVRSILQHSSPGMKNNFPCQGVRKISKAAQSADEEYLLGQTYEVNHE